MGQAKTMERFMLESVYTYGNQKRSKNLFDFYFFLLQPFDFRLHHLMQCSQKRGSPGPMDSSLPIFLIQFLLGYF